MTSLLLGLFFPKIASASSADHPTMEACLQLVLVTTPSWKDTVATIHCFERSTPNTPWKLVLGPYEAVVGKNGLAWGRGLQEIGLPEKSHDPIKKESDLRAPAGVFLFGEAFGYAPPEQAAFIKLPYRQLTETIEGVDDPHSLYYNRIVDTQDVPEIDWSSFEVMRRSDELYRWGIVIKHNWENLPDAGSCIYMHLWRGPGQGTAGCTAMAPENLKTILSWLDPAQQPLLVQLPLKEYETWKKPWHLP